MVVSRALETSVASRFLRHGALCINSPDSKLIATNKYATLQQLADADIPVPRSFLSSTSDDIEQIVGQLSTPVVLKTLDGTRGVGVVRCDSLESARSTFDALQMSGQPFLVQKYISESKGQDVRVLVLGGRVLGAMRCFPRKGDFRSNIARGAQTEPITLPTAYEKLALRAAQTIGVDLAGVDLIESDDGPLVLEVNPVPGFEKIDSMCSIDAALAMVEYIEARHALSADPSGYR
jgi:ribosomal protein S6--L-glutamate ligase